MIIPRQNTVPGSGRVPIWLQNIYFDAATYRHACKGLYGKSGGLVLNNQVPCLELNGIDDKINFGDNFRVGLGSFSISFWAKLTGSTTYQRIFQKATNTVWYRLRINQNSNSLFFDFKDVDGNIFSITFSAAAKFSEWAHYEIRVNERNSVELFVNGVKHTNVFESGTLSNIGIVDAESVFYFGSASTVYYAQGEYLHFLVETATDLAVFNLQENAGQKMYSICGNYSANSYGSGSQRIRVDNITNPQQAIDLKRVTADEGTAYVPAIISDAQINIDFTNVTLIELLTGMYKDDGSRLNLHGSENDTEVSQGVTISDKLREKNTPIALQAGIKLDNYTATIDAGKSTKSLKLK